MLPPAANNPVAGVDEAGRGPWAGPVVTAAVIIPDGIHIDGLDDSKKLSAVQRDQLFGEIWAQCSVGIAASSIERIAQMNILAATLDAMTRAVASLPNTPGLVLIDGNRAPKNLKVPVETVIGGDALVPEISAASIVAKVLRDRIMEKLAHRYPGYGWESNAGYGVPKHQQALNQWGITPHHRTTFAPIRKIMESRKKLLIDGTEPLTHTKLNEAAKTDQAPFCH